MAFMTRATHVLQWQVQREANRRRGANPRKLVDQLKHGSLEQGAIASHYPLTLRMQEGYDHGYYFVATFIEDHLRHHARALL